ncbi:hypothetical protein BC939DRAFT_498473 [Gamsiella multidivaricata]|uniref:uncharacterized protein n=1 Tax=Gamsiella multidivaricata TaxID=101098 RepID=UPI00221EA42B|nr:uncharacterized protein BC939DRAFT_498473 [Gamsiella multidivaricata]KAI7832395.1 hypothetical protein BC939DRAFT_498473 [Gamsiella multidivaricata]
MDGVDCDWCLVCDKRTSSGATYCSAECRSSDLISSSASSSSSSASSSSFSMTDPNGALLPAAASSVSSLHDNYQMPPFVRKQRTSIPNIYAHCTSNPNPPGSLYLSPGGNGSSALSHHLQQQQSSTAPPAIHLSNPLPGSAAAQYPLFYATLNALRPISPSGPPQDQ